MNLYYMRDNHTFRQLPAHVEQAMSVLQEEYLKGYNHGMLCRDAPRRDSICHGGGTFDEFEPRAREWLTAEIAYKPPGELEYESWSVAPENPPNISLHPRTADLVDRFAIALKEKLAAAEKKYGYSDSWANPDWMHACRVRMLEHVAKGDPRDVAAYCAFLWHHGEPTIK